MPGDPRISRSQLLVLCLVTFGTLVAADTPAYGRAGAESVAGFPPAFIENRGQLDEPARFLVAGQDRDFYFTSGGVTVALASSDAGRWIVRLEFLEGRPGCAPRGEDATETVFSYFRGRPAEWQAGVPTYRRIVYEDLWPGIDLVYRLEADRLRYEFVVDPGADPDRIRIAYRGAERVARDADGSLIVHTPFGGWRDAPPCSYQKEGPERRDVSVAFRVDDDPERTAKIVRFALGPYDPSRALVIDPELVIHAGFIGGTGTDTATDIAVDAEGNSYITGYTGAVYDGSFPTVVGPDLAYGGGSTDAFVAKVNAEGTALVYCGYIGGGGYDVGENIAVDAEGNAYVAGYTNSWESGFPLAVGPDLTYGGGDYDGFVAKVNAAGTHLEYCGYIGGDESDQATGIAVDTSGHAYLTGNTMSSEATFPVVVGPDVTYDGAYDAFVAKVASSGATLEYCGYIGGSNSDWGNAITIDAMGRALVAGSTGSNETSFPVRTGPDLTHNGYYDVFVAAVTSDGTDLVHCGYIGGNRIDGVTGIAVDAEGAILIAGSTESTETSFPVRVGPELVHDGGPYNAPYDSFVAKIASDASDLVYCGYLGGSEMDQGSGIAVDTNGNACVCGWTQSSAPSFPVRGGPTTTRSGSSDAFVARISPGGGIEFCGYLGGTSADLAAGIAIGIDGSLHITGWTYSPNFPVQTGPDLSQFSGVSDTFFARLPAYLSCHDGTVGLSESPTPRDSVFVNGSAGTSWRTVFVTTDSPIEVAVSAPNGPFLAPFALYVWIGEADPSTVTPQPFGVGTMCFPTPLNGGSPQPHRIWNNIGKRPWLGEPHLPSEPAPTVVAYAPEGWPRPVTVTLQGFILDDASEADKPASVTNAVILSIR